MQLRLRDIFIMDDNLIKQEGNVLYRLTIVIIIIV